MPPMVFKGTVGFSREKGSFVSKAIRWFTRSQWSHTFIIYQMSPEILVLEAGTFEVKIVPITKYESSKYVTTFFVAEGLTQESVEAGIERARRKIEKPYGYLQLLGFIPIVAARRLFGSRISNPARGGVVCSELVLEYLRGAEPGQRWDSMQKDSVSPEDLHAELALHSAFKKIEST